MKLTRDQGITISGAHYSVKVEAEQPRALLYTVKGELMAELFLLFSSHSDVGRDVSGNITPWVVEEIQGGYTLKANADSSIWSDKGIELTLLEDQMIYKSWVKGEGALFDTELLSGYYTGSNKRWGNARFYSGFHADSLFNPDPSRNETYLVSPQQRSLIDLTGVPIPGRDHWFFTPVPFCFVLRKDSQCLSLGVQAQPGYNTFTEFEYTGGEGQGLVLRYEGYTKVSGRFDLPTLRLLFGEDEYEVLGRFAGLEARVPHQKKTYDWWKKPIVCGWGAQCARSGQYNQPASTLATQDFYVKLDAALAEKDLDPGILVIDDKWQVTYGGNEVDTDKWPDMKSFIRDMHDKGRKVLLWLKAWDPEGVDPALCIVDHLGRPQAIDPENPDYLRLFKGQVHELLSPEGMDADGFKIDFTARIPSCPGCKGHGGSWGLELMRAYLVMVFDAAKEAKQDALVMCHCPHPYLEDKLDMIRLNDINTGRPVNDQMTHRAKVVQAVMPDVLIDTDNWPMPNKQAWLDYVRLQPSLGIPSLYYLWHMDNSDETISQEDLDVVRDSWKEWEEKQRG